MKNIIASLFCGGACMHMHVCALTHTGTLIVKEQKQGLGTELLLGRARFVLLTLTEIPGFIHTLIL